MGQLHTDVLKHLAERVAKRRAEHLEDIAKGKQPDQYWKVVGRAAECKDFIEMIKEEVERFDEDEERDDD